MNRQLGILLVFCFMVLAAANHTKAIEVPLKEEIKYNHNSMTISEVKKHVPFNVIVPENVPDDWTLEIKTYPWGTKTDFTSFSLHYMDRNDGKMLVSITQKKSIAKQTKEYIPNAKTISINGHLGRLTKWGNDGEVDRKGEIITGGLLQWSQKGTDIEIHSSRIPKAKMVDIARSMKKSLKAK
ncbi:MULTISPECIES: DUF4367 domain-containing protein [Bacillus]|uniref:DUF4367 domain-containing protein n=1 Tax=Bacillus TaxID=1386 RepID=UPI001F0E74CD|nr:MULTISPECIES: DUF4367 domain-containing protein [Bacillus]MCP1156897.1 DUF4367 domain-containing protein [Bacillus infantis]MDT0160786.1 DUF4367 domain-containing protein [Bacillus sp. AG4(2022)]